MIYLLLIKTKMLKNIGSRNSDSHASLHDPAAFSTLQAVGGVALLAEALLEARTPTLPAPTKKLLTVFIDGPLLMQHMGLSGASG